MLTPSGRGVSPAPADRCRHSRSAGTGSALVRAEWRRRTDPSPATSAVRTLVAPMSAASTTAAEGSGATGRMTDLTGGSTMTILLAYGVTNRLGKDCHERPVPGRDRPPNGRARRHRRGPHGAGAGTRGACLAGGDR